MARPTAPDRRSLPLPEWPAPDREAWAAAIAEGDLLEGQGPAAHWAAQTRRTNITHYGRWLGFLAWRNELDPDSPPAGRATRERIGAYERHLHLLVAPRSRLALLVGLKVMLQAMAPEQNWRWLQDLCNRIQRTARPVTDKRSRMRPTGEIVRAALQELAACASIDPTSHAPANLALAVRYRDALMLALLAARPLRVKNFSTLSLDRHLRKIDARWLIAIPAAESKTREAVESFVPDLLLPWLERYLADVRPLFLGAAASPLLWLRRDPRPMGPGFVYGRIARLTRRLFGRALNPHLFRDCAASSLANESPEMARAAAALLGHRHLSTTERFYIQADRIAASRRLNRLLEEVRAECTDEEPQP